MFPNPMLHLKSVKRNWYRKGEFQLPLSELPVSVDQGIECQSISPTGGKVFDLHSIIPGIKCTVIHTIYKPFLDTCQV